MIKVVKPVYSLHCREEVQSYIQATIAWTPEYRFNLTLNSNKNNNRSSGKTTGKKLHPLLRHAAEEDNHPVESLYSCSPSNEGPLRLKLSSKFIKARKLCKSMQVPVFSNYFHIFFQ